MIKILVGLSVFIAGGVVGGYGYYIAIHSKVDYSSDASALISQILLHSNQEIADGNYRCESGGNQNAREVLSSIIGGGLAYTAHRGIRHAARVVHRRRAHGRRRPGRR